MITKEEIIENLFKSSRIKTITMTRINYGSKRLYVAFNPFGAYSGLTGALNAATFKGNIDNKRLDGWRNKMINELGSIERQEAYLNTMADFGTIVHEVLVRAWEQGYLDWEKEKEYAENYFIGSAQKNKIAINENVLQAQVFEYCKSAASIMQFLYDEVEELFAVESMCKSDVLQIATPVDVVCKLKNGKIVTLNIKTSSQISDHQREQVAMERYLWNATYPDCQADVTGIIRPKDWSLRKGVPTYELEILGRQTEDLFLGSALTRLQLCKNDSKSSYINWSNETVEFTGQTKVGEAPKLETKTLEEILTKIN